MDKLPKKDLEKIQQEFHAAYHDMRKMLVQAQNAITTLCMPVEKQMLVPADKLEEFQEQVKWFMDHVVEQFPELVELGKQLGRLEAGYELDRKLAQAMKQLTAEEQALVILPQGYVPDMTCVVDGCQRAKHFGNYCKKHVPDSERPRGKV